MRTRRDRCCPSRVAVAVACLLTGVAAMGCGSSTPATSAVRGRVTFEGKPLPGGGTIRFVPVSLPGKEAGGAIAEDGSYEMQTYEEKDGAIPGDHRVEIFQNQILKPEVYPEIDPGEGKEPDAVKAISPEVRISPKERIPPIYSDSRSPLRATVDGTKSNEINFDLKRTP